MSTITKEFTKEQLQQIAETDHVQCGDAAAMARQLLASMEQEPVIIVGDDGGDALAYRRLIQSFAPGTKLYAAPQLPQPEVLSVPDERAAFETFMEKRFKDCIDRRLVKNGDGEYFAWDMQIAWIVWQGRAAMFQGAEPVQGWIPCSEVMPAKMIPVMVMYEDGEMWSAIWTGTKWDDGTDIPDPHTVTHWQEMPAAPQQEVK